MKREVVEAEEHWRAGRALDAGRVLYEALPAERRPAWAAGVLDVFCGVLDDVPSEVEAVREIARTPTRWSQAHAAFRAVRELVLLLESPTRPPANYDDGLLYLAENVAKVTYNASGSRAPFDHNAGWWIVSNARWLLDRAEDADLGARAWTAMTRIG